MATKGPDQTANKRIKDPVSEMRIFADGVRKEKQKQIVYDSFQINQPKKINFQTQKPNNNPFLLMKLKEQGKSINGVDIDEKLNDNVNRTELGEELNSKLKTVTHVPKQKWGVAQTTAQEIGWFNEHFTPQHEKFVHKRNKCNETEYADGYYTMKHVSLFSDHKKK